MKSFHTKKTVPLGQVSLGTCPMYPVHWQHIQGMPGSMQSTCTPCTWNTNESYRETGKLYLLFLFFFYPFLGCMKNRLCGFCEEVSQSYSYLSQCPVQALPVLQISFVSRLQHVKHMADEQCVTILQIRDACIFKHGCLDCL